MKKQCVFLKALPTQSKYFREDKVLSQCVKILDQYKLSNEILKDIKVLILTMHQDQRHLLNNKQLLMEFIQAGGTIIIQGQIAMPFLDCLIPFNPAGQLTLEEYEISFIQPHSVFQGINPLSLNCRRGVRGFYARGSNPPPEDATILTTIKRGTISVDWEWSYGLGRVFVHSGNDIWTSFKDSEDNIDITRNLVSWAIQENPEK
ncbi:MAG: hypothetical protein COB23_03280 [Methylophaga sp.]|nr:MAG: hypothetical protein COB23_03280 [Methylophaga sp.]